MFRDDNPRCPSCDAALVRTSTRLICEHCHGALVPDAAIAELLAELAPHDHRSVAERLAPATAPPRHCPCCAAVMEPSRLYETVVDRCAAHGTWFDAGELEDVLASCGEVTHTRLAMTRTTAYVALGSGWVGLVMFVLGASILLPILMVAGVVVGDVVWRRLQRRTPAARPPQLPP
jgi:Zn-finger nucleic acid-binding protein